MTGEARDSTQTGEPVALVMDLGGNWMRVALVNQGGELLWRDRQPTRAHESREDVIGRIDNLLYEGISQAGQRKIAGIGLGVAAPVDPETGLMYNPPNIPSLDGVSLKSLWEPRVEWPVLVGNDATLAALGEYRYGAGADARMLVYLTVSTGIGGGVVIDGRPMMGSHGMAGELGHMCVDRNGPIDKCGNVGCLEGLASGTAIGDIARSRVTGKSGSIIEDLVSGELDRISAETVFQAAGRGDPVAKGVVDEAGRALGAGLVSVIHIFNPDVIVIGGGVSQDWEYLRPSVESYIEAHAMGHVRRLGFKLAVSSLGDDIGLLGAAALVWQG